MENASKPDLSNHPDAVRSRQRWAEKHEKSLAYHRAYQARRCAEDPEYLEKVRARGRRAAANRRARIQARILAAQSRPCVDCGNSSP